MRLYRLRCATIADGDGLPIFSVVDYVTGESGGDAIATFKELRPEFRGHEPHVEQEIEPVGVLPEWIVSIPLEGGAHAVVLVAAKPHEIHSAMAESLATHPVYSGAVATGMYKVKWRVDRTRKGCWA